MKATAFLTTVLAVSMTLISCKDNTMEVQTGPHGDAKNLSTQDMAIIWSHDGISVEANGDALVERELESQFAQQYVYDVMITFDAWATLEADRFPGYIPELNVYTGNGATNAPVLSESSISGINRHHTLYVNLGGFNTARFHIALRCASGDVDCQGGASLRISNIKIFRLEPAPPPPSE